MTLEEIKKRIQDIKYISDDDEMAHAAEDELMRDFICYVAGMTDEDNNLPDKAFEILKTQNIDFCRWCA